MFGDQSKERMRRDDGATWKRCTESDDKLQVDSNKSRQIVITSTLEEEVLREPTLRGHGHKTEAFRADQSGFHYSHFLLWLEILKGTPWGGGKHKLKESKTSCRWHLSESWLWGTLGSWCLPNTVSHMILPFHGLDPGWTNITLPVEIHQVSRAPVISANTSSEMPVRMQSKIARHTRKQTILRTQAGSWSSWILVKTKRQGVEWNDGLNVLKETCGQEWIVCLGKKSSPK